MTTLEYLMSKVGHKGDECLIWPYARDDKGYGQVCTQSIPRVRKAHRVMCEIVNGHPPTQKHQASHNCGKGHEGCFHPRHLEWKTNRQNQLDRRGHGTKNIGYGIHGLLTKAQAAEILKTCLTMTVREASMKFGIKRGSVDYWRKKAKEAA